MGYNLSHRGHTNEGHPPIEHTTLLGCQSNATSSPRQVTQQELDST